MAEKMKLPFVPNMEDCKRVVETAHGTCYIMDTYCKNFTAEDKKRIDREIVRIYQTAMLRKQTKDLA